MQKPKSFRSILIPSATVFFSSACIMVLELVASRLIARHLGSSLYTWTSVIGIVLAGITIGNYLGGRIADRFPAKKALAVLLGIASVTCVATVILNNLIGQWMLLWYFRWPVRVFAHVLLVFIVPSTLLGTISPVVAKMALDQELPTGRTVGDIYAWGAAGSIAGTFLTGYYLIATMGTIAIIWTVAAALLAMAILYWARFWALYVWAVIFIALMTMAIAPADWAEDTAARLALRQAPDPDIIYEDESQYSYIAVKQTSKKPDTRAFMQDKLMHSQIIMDDALNLQYYYEQIYAAVTHLLSQDQKTLSVLVIGGGGYVFPRYIEKVWPGSRVDVAEIDPGVTRAATRAFGLEPDTTINTFTMDARNYVSQLLQQTEDQKILYDFIYEDALDDYSIPYQLTTKEFNDKIFRILSDTGVYMIELIGIFDSGLFVGSFINTLEQTFPYVYVVTKRAPRSERNTFIIIAAKQQINLENLRDHQAVKSVDLWILTDSDIETLREKAHRIVLTDNFAPVENMLAPVVRKSGVDLLSGEYHDMAQELKHHGKLDQSITLYQELIQIDPAMSITAYTAIANMMIQQDRLDEAAKAFQKAIKYNQQAETKMNIAGVHLALGLLMKKPAQPNKSKEHFLKAIEGFTKKFNKNPESHDTLFGLGVALVEVGEFSEATKYLQQAVNKKPSDFQGQLALARILVKQKRYDEAVTVLKKAIAAAPGRYALTELQTYLQLVKTKTKY